MHVATVPHSQVNNLLGHMQVPFLSDSMIMGKLFMTGNGVAPSWLP
jgi:hypothetical protein